MKNKLFTFGLISALLISLIIGGAEVIEANLTAYGTFSIISLSMIIGGLITKMANN